MTAGSTVRKQIRGFVIIWIAITFIMGLSTFLAVYSTYNPTALDIDAGRPLPLNAASASGEKAAAALIVLPSIPPAPTFTLSPPPPTPGPPLAAVEMPLSTDTPAPSPTPTRLPIDDRRYQVGIQVQHSLDFNPDNQDGWFNSVSNDLGMTWVKQQLRWELMESEQGAIDWSVLDLVLPSAEKFGIKLMLSIVTAPNWAREPEADTERHGPPADPQTFADFVARILERYPGKIHALEVWNEQNIDREWTSTAGLSASHYVALLRRTYETVKAIDPGIIVISGALSPTGVNDGIQAYDDFSYMDQMIAADMLDWADCVGAHHNGYNVSPDFRYSEIPNDPDAVFRGPFDNPHHSWSFRSTLEGYANRIRAAGRDTKLCVTEFGWPSVEDLAGFPPRFEFAQDNMLAEQAQWIPKAMDNMEKWGFVWLAFVWNFNYGPQAGYAADNDNVPYSLIGPDFTFRPAYDAIRAWQRDYLARTGA